MEESRCQEAFGDRDEGVYRAEEPSSRASWNEGSRLVPEYNGKMSDPLVSLTDPDERA